MNPVLEGYISYSDLKNGTLNLYDVYLLNKVIDKKVAVAEEENRRIKRQAALKKVK
jgi:hypothetical protein